MREAGTRFESLLGDNLAFTLYRKTAEVRRQIEGKYLHVNRLPDDPKDFGDLEGFSVGVDCLKAQIEWCIRAQS